MPPVSAHLWLSHGSGDLRLPPPLPVSPALVTMSSAVSALYGLCGLQPLVLPHVPLSFRLECSFQWRHYGEV